MTRRFTLASSAFRQPSHYPMQYTRLSRQSFVPAASCGLTSYEGSKNACMITPRQHCSAAVALAVMPRL